MRFLWLAVLLVGVHLCAQDVQAQIDALEQRLKLKTHDTQMHLGGRIQLDGIATSHSVGKAGATAYDYFLTPRSISTTDKKAMQTDATATGSRIFMKTRRIVDESPLETLIEVDFGGQEGNQRISNSHHIRLRHAYVQYKGFVVGQAFSTFMGGAPDSLQESFDNTFLRAPLVRYTKRIDDVALSVAVELPETTYIDNNASIDTSSSNDEDRVPDIVGKIVYSNGTVSLHNAWALRGLRLDGVPTVWGYAVSATALVRTVGMDTLNIGYRGGNALGRYVAYNFFADTVKEGNVLHARMIHSMHAAYQHWILPNLRANIVYSSIHANSDKLLQKSLTKHARAVVTNLRYVPVKHTLLTLEYAYAQRAFIDEREFDMHRVMLSARYDF